MTTVTDVKKFYNIRTRSGISLTYSNPIVSTKYKDQILLCTVVVNCNSYVVAMHPTCFIRGCMLDAFGLVRRPSGL